MSEISRMIVLIWDCQISHATIQKWRKSVECWHLPKYDGQHLLVLPFKVDEMYMVHLNGG